ncbi:MAG TPA: ATP-binding protein [Chloroflexota bacterium]|nr:ATP-binding protein [Chloroflexota bacterium]
MTPESLRLPVRGAADAERARREARTLAARQGFDAADAERVALAVSELATNLVRYARQGEILLGAVDGARGRGIEVESRDAGPGIGDVARALEDGYTTGGGLGSGLPGVRRLMDDFEISSAPSGTRVLARKWLPAQ